MAFKLFVFLLTLAPLALCQETVVVLDSQVTKENPKVLHCGVIESLKENDTLRWTYTNATGSNKTYTGQSLSLNITDEKATGIYVCELNDVEIATYLAARLVQAVIMNTRKSVTYNNGDVNRKITCAVDGSYPAPDFIWKRRGEIEDEAPILVSTDTNPNFLINTTGDRSVLMFHNISYGDQANYICEVTNAAGNNSVEVMIRVKDKYAAIWPFCGIVIEVVVLISIIFLYERHSKQTSELEEKVPTPEDEKPLKCEEGTEIRNRNVNQEE